MGGFPGWLLFIRSLAILAFAAISSHPFPASDDRLKRESRPASAAPRTDDDLRGIAEATPMAPTAHKQTHWL
ncbi:hypothetical protein P0D69_46225 [Paraburkholderia sediminicola]|uniref:hypothetical protein n=1 Tax=Paraburkholderia sediminicola TaxID=458836 RepID=UPI0038BB0D96